MCIIRLSFSKHPRPLQSWPFPNHKQDSGNWTNLTRRICKWSRFRFLITSIYCTYLWKYTYNYVQKKVEANLQDALLPLSPNKSWSKKDTLGSLEDILRCSKLSSYLSEIALAQVLPSNKWYGSPKGWGTGTWNKSLDWNPNGGHMLASSSKFRNGNKECHG